MKLVLFTLSILVGLAGGLVEISCAVAQEPPMAAPVWQRADGPQRTELLAGSRHIPPGRTLHDVSAVAVHPDQQHVLNVVDLESRVPVRWREHDTLPILWEDATDHPQVTGPADFNLPQTTQVYPSSFATTSFAGGQQSGFPQHPSHPTPGVAVAWQKGSWQITPYGYLTGEVIASDASVTARSFVLYVNEAVGEREPQFTPHGQTTALGFDFKGPPVGPLQSDGSILFNFLGDRPVLNQSTPFLLRAFGALHNEDWRFGFGVAPDIFGAQTARTVNFGGNLQAGNIAAFRGQLRVERNIRLADDVRWTTFAAISQQVVSDFTDDPLTIGTDNGWPNIEGRLLWELGPSNTAEAPIQLAVSGVVGQTRALGLASTNVSSTWGVSADGQLVGDRFGARYEVFSGEAIGTYNAAIGQSLNPENGEPISTVGGFAEVWCRLHDSLTWHVGYGVDNPRDGDLGRKVDPTLGPVAGQRSRNSVGWTNVFWNVTEAFELGFEVSYRETDYIAPSVSNEAMVYHFRTRLIF